MSSPIVEGAGDDAASSAEGSAGLPTAAERTYRRFEARMSAPTAEAPFRTFAEFAKTVRSDPPHRLEPHRRSAGHTDSSGANTDSDDPNDPNAVAALAQLAATLRANDYGGEAIPSEPTAHACFRLGYGDSAERRIVERVVGRDGLDALVAARWAEYGDLDPAYVRLTMTVFATESVLTVSPRPAPGLDTVYIGPDSLALLRRAWASGLGGRAADLGTGNGFIAAALATRFDYVVATDLSARCAWAASLVPVLNPFLAGRIGVVRADVGDGLAPRTFDLVTANPPWVPETMLGERDPGRRFAAGGPTGFELPRRFIDAAASLLAPRGRAFISCLDIELADGRRPLRDHALTLEQAGCAVEIHRSHMVGGDDMRVWVRNRLGRVRSAAHVIVELHAHAI